MKPHEIRPELSSHLPNNQPQTLHCYTCFRRQQFVIGVGACIGFFFGEVEGSPFVPWVLFQVIHWV